MTNSHRIYSKEEKMKKFVLAFVLVALLGCACQAVEPAELIEVWDNLEIVQVSNLTSCQDFDRYYACNWVLVGDQNSANIGVDEECVRFDVKWANGVRLIPEYPFLPVIDIEAVPGEELYLLFIKGGEITDALIVRIDEDAAVG